MNQFIHFRTIGKILIFKSQFWLILLVGILMFTSTTWQWMERHRSKMTRWNLVMSHTYDSYNMNSWMTQIKVRYVCIHLESQRRIWSNNGLRNDWSWLERTKQLEFQFCFQSLPTVCQCWFWITRWIFNCGKITTWIP